MAAVGRLLLALAVVCALVTSCSGPRVDTPPSAPLVTHDEMPDARSVAAVDTAVPATSGTPAPTAAPTLEPAPPTDAVPQASEPLAPATPVVDLPGPTPTTDALPRDLPPPSSIRTVAEPRAVPILMYHYIRVNPVRADRIGFGLSVTPADFEAQMSYLEAHGYRSVTPADIASGAAFRGPGRPVALTFDDGYDDAYTVAYPILASHGFRATFYVITDLVGRPRYMTWDQVRTLAAAGEVIGSHTESHPDLTRLDLVSLFAQLAVSRWTLEAQLGQPVLDFCYPAGRFNPAVKAEVGRVGYRTATTERPGPARATDDLLVLPRVRVYGGITLDRFATLVEGAVPAAPARAPAS